MTIKVELEVSDLLSLASARQEDKDEIDRQQDSARQAWRHLDQANETIANLRSELATVKAIIPANASQDSWVNMAACRDLFSAIEGKGKIAAIKAVRTLTRCGLREAKDLVEEFPLFRPSAY